MMSNEWLPRKEQDLVSLLARWDAWLNSTAKQKAFGWDTSECALVALKIGDFLSARIEYHISPMPENRLDKDEKKEVIEEAMRVFANSSIRYNTQMTDAERLFLGIHPQDNTADKGEDPASGQGPWSAIQRGVIA
jgi:hypothetical protein